MTNATVPDAPPAAESSMGPATVDPAVAAEWARAGWSGAPAQVHDPDSGVGVHLLGEAGAPQSNAGPDGTTRLSSVAPKGPDGVTTLFVVSRKPGLQISDLQLGAESIAKGIDGRIVSSTPVTIAGRPGLDLRVETPLVIILRRSVLVDDNHIAVVSATGAADAERTITQAYEFVTGSLRIPR
jgi:hypothetical protein